ncbi:hypothetical protein ACFFSY_32310 [Paenibacillus aurantiacus]|uniref:Uncharacterized protein n=1 Tax=Paenibacillus aurantiacus TaxID=1936118 RepID=A0ABV5KZM6_9BACL
MLKQELLQEANQVGIHLSSHMFERYVQHSFIISDKSGRGYYRGVQTNYHERTLETLMYIDRLKSEKRIKNQKDYIFALFWRGYPVDWYKLKARLMEFHSNTMKSFKVIAVLSENREYQELLDEIAEEEASKSPKAIGRPSRETLQIKENEAKEFAKGYIWVSQFISGILKNNAISPQVFDDFNQQAKLKNQYLNDSILLYANNWLQLKTWRDAVKQSNELDYEETYKVIHLMKEYWGDLESTYGSVYDIPVIGELGL